jgi:cob(I)alamin adenosyltransferase
MLKKGIIQIYTGNGKGKTTAALGLVLRALGSNFKVALVQFLKHRDNVGEIQEIQKKFPEVIVHQFGTGNFVTKNNVSDADRKSALEGLNKAKELIQSNQFDLIVLDEINVVTYFGIIDPTDVLELIQNKPENLELVLTGRYASKEIINVADLVTEMKEIKHPYNNGFQARKGIEY